MPTGWTATATSSPAATSRFLLPPLVVAIAAGAIALATWGLQCFPARWRNFPLRSALTIVPLALILLLVLYPIIPLRRYYTHEASLDPDNATFLETVRFVQQVRGPRTPVLIDEFMAKIDLKDGAEALEILYILFSLEGIPYRIVPDPGEELARLGPTLDPNDTEALPIIVMMYDRCYPIRDRSAPCSRSASATNCANSTGPSRASTPSIATPRRRRRRGASRREAVGLSMCLCVRAFVTLARAGGLGGEPQRALSPGLQPLGPLAPGTGQTQKGVPLATTLPAPAVQRQRKPRQRPPARATALWLRHPAVEILGVLALCARRRRRPLALPDAPAQVHR